MFVVNTEQLKRLENAGMLADLTDVYETWGSDRLKSILSAEEAVLETATVDDRLYAIPQLSSGYHPELLWLRSDWMEELKKENPKTVDELDEILLGMKELSGTYSFAVGEDLDSLYHLAVAWDAYPGFWQRQGRQLAFPDGSGKESGRNGGKDFRRFARGSRSKAF